MNSKDTIMLHVAFVVTTKDIQRTCWGDRYEALKPDGPSLEQIKEQIKKDVEKDLGGEWNVPSFLNIDPIEGELLYRLWPELRPETEKQD